jgi:hypothetical protein
MEERDAKDAKEEQQGREEKQKVKSKKGRRARSYEIIASPYFLQPRSSLLSFPRRRESSDFEACQRLEA